MADIELVIKIPEGIIEYVKNNDCLAVCFADEVAKAIKNGIQIPEGHEDLKLDKISEEIDDLRNFSYPFQDMLLNDVQKIIKKYKVESE